MHISEGVVAAPALLAGATLGLSGVALGVRRLEYDELPKVALFAAVFFTATLIHVPVGFSSAHLSLTGVCGLLLGWAAFPALFVGLTLQAILFQYGGLTTLGLNTFNMAFPAVAVGFLCRRAIKSDRKEIRILGEFLCAVGAVLLSGCLIAGSLALSGEVFMPAIIPILAAHVPIMVVEGLLTIFIVEFIRKVKPVMIPGMQTHYGTNAVENPEAKEPV